MTRYGVWFTVFLVVLCAFPGWIAVEVTAFGYTVPYLSEPLLYANAFLTSLIPVWWLWPIVYVATSFLHFLAIYYIAIEKLDIKLGGC